jgi:hypothetical protein
VVHQQIIQCGLELDVFLVDMYAKCGSMEYAWSVFNKDAILRCGYLDCHTWRMCDALAW